MKIAKYIDLTILKPDATITDVKRVCQEASEYGFAAVCIHPVHVRFACEYLKRTEVKVCTVVGFPLGANLTEIKAYEAKKAIEHGAQEIDMVMNIGALKDANYDLVLRDIRAVVSVCSVKDVKCKVIIEACLLNDEEKRKACELSQVAGAAFVKTSTGFGSGGATAGDVALIKKALNGTSVKIKAAGGIRDYTAAIEMIQAGATRIGTSAGVKIVEGLEKRDKKNH